jgi:hypothetical protein
MFTYIYLVRAMTSITLIVFGEDTSIKDRLCDMIVRVPGC